MDANPTIKTSERVGRWLGRVWRYAAYREMLAIHWLSEKGISYRGGRLLFGVIKLVFSAILLYAAFWFAVLLFGTVVGAWILAQSSPSDDSKPEWREGHSGFGLYDKNEWRKDMGDPQEPS